MMGCSHSSKSRRAVLCFGDNATRAPYEVRFWFIVIMGLVPARQHSPVRKQSWSRQWKSSLFNVSDIDVNQKMEEQFF